MSKFGIERFSNFLQHHFYNDKVNSNLNMPVLTIGAINKGIKSKTKFWRQSFL